MTQSVSFFSHFSEEGLSQLRESIHLALREDGDDLTSNALFSLGERMRASIVAKEKSIVAGMPLIPMVFEILGEPCHWQHLCPEGTLVDAMTEIARIHASARALLKAERVILNFITHLSGIANLTRRYVQELEDTGVILLDTRKTIPCLRQVEKYAVRLGGGRNHRMDLEEMLMLKDNHIDQAGSILEAVQRLRSTYASQCPPIEVECRTEHEVLEALEAKVNRIMMDNMTGDQLARALALVPPHIEVEISGGVCLENIRSLALTGTRRANFISVGRLTHSAPAADFSMRLNRERQNAQTKLQ